MAQKHRVDYEITATDSTQRALASVKANLAGVHSAVMGVRAMLLTLTPVLVGGAGLATFLRHAIMVRSALDDLADTTGDSVTTWDGMRRVAHVAGVELDQVANAATKLARNLNSADDDGKAAGEAIKAIGLNVEELKDKKPAEAMFEIAMALAGFEDGAAKVAIVTALMGREGAKMLPFLKDLAEQGELQGRITAEQAAQAELLEKEWRRLSLAWNDAAEDMASSIIPQLSALVEWLNDGARSFGSIAKASEVFFTQMLKYTPIGWMVRLRENATGGVTQAPDNPFSAQAGAGAFTPRRQLSFRGPARASTPAALREQLTEGEKLLRQLEEQLAKTGELSMAEQVLALLQTQRYASVDEATKKQAVALASEIDLKRSMSKFEQDQEAQRQASAAAVNERRRREGARSLDAMNSFRESQKESIEQFEFEIGLIGRTAHETDRLTKFREIDRAAAQAAAQIDKELYPERVEAIMRMADVLKNRWGKALDEAREKERDWLTGAKKALQEYHDNATNLALQTQEFFTNSFQSMEDALVSFVKTGKLDFRSLADSIISDLIRIQVRTQITGPLAGFFSGIFGGAAGAAGGVGGGGGGTMFAAAGGTFGAGSDVIVGEEGPELVRFKRGGTVIPNHELGGGGVTIIQHMTFGSDVNRGTLVTWGREIERRTAASVSDMMRRGHGAFRPA